MKRNKRIQIIVFKKKRGDVLFLILKRSKKDGGFWQFTTGTPEKNEIDTVCIYRELKEETGITNKLIKQLFEKFYSFEWNKNNKKINEYVYAVEVDIHTKISLSTEHVRYKWATKKECEKLFKYKSSIDSLNELLIKNFNT